MSFYPIKVQAKLDSPQNAGSVPVQNATGRSASFQCGSFVAFSLRIESESKIVLDAVFRSNGCGYMTAAADLLADTVKGLHLGELHGLDSQRLSSEIDSAFGIFPGDRRQCSDVCVEALRSAFADFRSRQIDEFSGEKALVCTCFSVTEEIIERHIDARSLTTVDQVTDICNAGGGCGSCRMLIQEMIDRSESQL